MNAREYRREPNQEFAEIEWLKNQDTSGWFFVSLTMHQCVDGQRLDEIVASKVCRCFLNRLNQKTLQNEFRKKRKRLGCIPFIEQKNGRIHYHVGIEKPQGISNQDFSETLKSCWEKSPFSARDIQIDETYSPDWIDYCYKHQTSNINTLDLNNLYIKQ